MVGGKCPETRVGEGLRKKKYTPLSDAVLATYATDHMRFFGFVFSTPLSYAFLTAYITDAVRFSVSLFYPPLLCVSHRLYR